MPVYIPSEALIYQVAGRAALYPDARGQYTITASITTASNGSTNVSTTITAGAISFGSGGLGNSGAVVIAGSSTLQWNGSNTDDISSRLTINNGVIATLDVGINEVSLTAGFGGSGLGAG